MAQGFISVEFEEERLHRAMSAFLRDAVPERVDLAVRTAAFQTVALTTRALNGVGGLPKRIDTGRLRAGWRVSAAAAGLDPLDVPSSSSPDNPTRPADGSGTVTREGERVVAVLSNNVEYARYVEDGTAVMAPGHHLKRALHKVARPFRKALAQGLHSEFTG